MQKSKLLFIVALFFSQALLYSAGLPSSYYQMDDNAKQKEEFIRYMKVLVDKSNEEIRKDREFITGFFTKAVPDAFRGLNQQDSRRSAGATGLGIGRTPRPRSGQCSGAVGYAGRQPYSFGFCIP